MQTFYTIQKSKGRERPYHFVARTCTMLAVLAVWMILSWACSNSVSPSPLPSSSAILTNTPATTNTRAATSMITPSSSPTAYLTAQQAETPTAAQLNMVGAAPTETLFPNSTPGITPSVTPNPFPLTWVNQPMELISRSYSGWPAQGRSIFPALSGDGRLVAFYTDGIEASPGQIIKGLVLYDRQSGEWSQVDGNGNAPSLSADGHWISYVVITKMGVNDHQGHLNTIYCSDIILYDRQANEKRIISRLPENNPKLECINSASPQVSANGAFVTFVSLSISQRCSVIVYEIATQEYTCASVSSNGDMANEQTYASSPAISADGRFVAFTSYANNLTPGDTNACGEGYAPGDGPPVYQDGHCPDVFVHDRLTGETKLVSVRSDGAPANGYSAFPSISADGRLIAFHSLASNLVANDTNRTWDVFVHDMHTGTNRRVSITSQRKQLGGDFPSISADGRYAIFHTRSAKAFLENCAENCPEDGYWVHDLVTGTTTLVGFTQFPDRGGSDFAEYTAPVISADGQVVIFVSEWDALCRLFVAEWTQWTK